MSVVVINAAIIFYALTLCSAPRSSWSSSTSAPRR